MSVSKLYQRTPLRSHVVVGVVPFRSAEDLKAMAGNRINFSSKKSDFNQLLAVMCDGIIITVIGSETCQEVDCSCQICRENFH